MATAELLDRFGLPIWVLDPGAARVIHANRAARAFGLEAGLEITELEARGAQMADLTLQRQPVPWGAGEAPAVVGITGPASRFRLAARAAGLTVFDWDMGSGALDWACEGGTPFGYDPAVFPGHVDAWLDRLHPEDRARMTGLVGITAPQEREVWEESYRLLRADGTVAHVIDRGYLLRDANGEARRMVGAMIDISAMHEAEARFHLATSAAHDVLFIFDCDSGENWWSDALETRYGHAPAAGRGGVTFWLSLVHPNDRAWLVDSRAAALAAGAETWSEEYRFARADGSFAHVIGRMRFVRHADGRPARSVGSIVDITALREGQERFRLAAEASPDVIYDWSPDSGQIWRSENYATHFGLNPRANATGPGSWRAAIHPEDYPRIAALRDAALAEKIPRWEYAYRVRRGDGSIAHVIDRALAQRDAAGNLLRIIGSIVDVTRLREEGERLRALLHVAADAIYDVDLRAATVSWSEGMRGIFGHDWEGVHPRLTHWENAIHPDDRTMIARQFRAFIAGRQDDWRAEYRFRCGDGSYARVRDRARALRDDSGEAFRVIGSMEDVTAASEAVDRLHQAQKLEAVGKLTGGVAHDFNNLLTVIVGNAELLAAAAGSETEQALAEAVVQAAERGADLVRSLLSFARRQPLQPRLLAPPDVLAELTRMLARTLPAYVLLRLLTPAGLWPVEADPSQLQTALLNLALNACDAMPGGGQLMIEMSNVRLDAAYAGDNPGARAGDYLRIALSDTGAGMPPEVRDRAFDPFFTTKPAGKGSGLGLSMVHGFASQSGGHVKIYSELGEGTTVSLYLPRSLQDGTGSAPYLAPAVAMPMGHGEHVVVAEDDPALRGHVQRLVESLGYRVTAAADGDAALLAIRAAGDVALLFTDMVMPGELNGRLLAERACAEWPELRVLFTSGYTENSIVHHGRLDPGLHLLSKPYRRQDLALKLHQVLTGPPPDFGPKG